MSNNDQPDIATAYRVIVTLVDTLTASSDLIAVMAQLMGEDAVRPLQTDPAWLRYLEAKRRLEAVQDDMHRFAEAAPVQFERARLEDGEGAGPGS